MTQATRERSGSAATASPAQRSRVVVAGAGMAGLAAAVRAAEAGCEVLLLEKGTAPGGSFLLSEGRITTYQQEAVRALAGGNQTLQAVVAAGFADAVRWLGTQGVTVATRPGAPGGKAGYRVTPADCVRALLARLDGLGATIRTRSALAGLHRPGEAVAGAHVRERDGGVRLEPADAVILATGGFQGNPELVTRYCVPAHHVYHRSNPWSTGDGFLAAVEVGALASARMDVFYGHAMPAPPAAVTSSNFTQLTQYYAPHAVALNMAGQRFADESLGTGEEVLNQELARQPDGIGFYVGDETVAETGGRSDASVTARRTVARCEELGAVVVRAETLEELCQGLGPHGVNRLAAYETLRSYNELVASDRAGDLPVPRSAKRHAIDRAPFWAIKVKASITFSAGGLAVDGAMRVLDRFSSTSPLAPGTVACQPVPGLFAAGCDCGGFSGVDYLGGLASALVSGRQAGLSAFERGKVRP